MARRLQAIAYMGRFAAFPFCDAAVRQSARNGWTRHVYTQFAQLHNSASSITSATQNQAHIASRLNLHLAPKARASTEAKAAFTLSCMTQEQLPQQVERWSVSKSRTAQMVTAAAKAQKRGGGHACIGLVVRLTEDCEAFFPIPLVDRPVVEELKIMQPSTSAKGAETLVGQVVDEMKGMDYPLEEPIK